ncbi:MAG TPA: universal stress protein [Sphingomonadales bacterium]|nr:universal stress protein [Sphingomonadales bacterium]
MADKPKPKAKTRKLLKRRRRRFLVVIDDSPEAKVSLHFASARAAHVAGGTLVLFHAIAPAAFQHWVAVEDRMKKEARAAARELLKGIAAGVEADYGIKPEVVIREGNPKEELLKYIAEAADVFALFLGAHPKGDPGPLVDYFSGPLVGSLTCPVVIVPGSLTGQQIDAMA